MHNEKTYKPDLLRLIPAACLEQKYGGQKPDITTGFFPPDMSMPGVEMLTCDELKHEYPDAIRYLAPWGEKRAK